MNDLSLIIALVEVVVGLYVLIKAADVFVNAAVNVASVAKVSPVVVGAVVVGFGTSVPELLVSGIAAAKGNLDLGVGNVVGSNVANISLVLCAAALVVPILVTKAVLRREAPLSMLSVLLFAWFTVGGIQFWEGIVLLILLTVVLSLIIFGGHAESVEQIVVDKEDMTMRNSLLMAFLGLLGTIIGAQLVLWGAEATADAFNLTEGFVGYTLVAIGTSLPELVTVVTAARKGETELILGNLLGSNIFNSLAVGGLIAVLGPGEIVDELMRTYGISIMVIVAALAWVFMMVRKRITKVEAIVLLVIYVLAILMISETDIGESLRQLFRIFA